VRVPADAYYGAQTARAVENFPISGLRAHPVFLRASLLVKRAAAMSNMATGRLDRAVGEAICQAADEILADLASPSSRWRGQFVVDVYQAGAGTSHNMNVNEVLANRAAELLGGRRGEYTLVHPNDHVNMAHSTNDFFPTAMRVAVVVLWRETRPRLVALADSLLARAREFDPIVKAGRTHLQDATPIRLGQEFRGYGENMRRAVARIHRAAESVKELGLGGTAVGTGVNAEPEYIATVVQHISSLTGVDFRPAPDRVASMQSMADLAEFSGALRALAVDLSKLANDLRLLSSGPRAGLAEIVLPPVQPGSSIMPGKVNPVIAEMTNMVCFQVMGNDLTVALAAEAGQLELNVMMPVICHNLLFSLEILKNTARVLTERCVAGITADPERCRELVEDSLMLATALTPYIGYAEAARIAQEAHRSRRRVRDVVRERGIFSEEELERVLDPGPMTEPGIPGR